MASISKQAIPLIESILRAIDNLGGATKKIDTARTKTKVENLRPIKGNVSPKREIDTDTPLPTKKKKEPEGVTIQSDGTVITPYHPSQGGQATKGVNILEEGPGPGFSPNDVLSEGHRSTFTLNKLEDKMQELFDRGFTGTDEALEAAAQHELDLEGLAALVGKKVTPRHEGLTAKEIRTKQSRRKKNIRGNRNDKYTPQGNKPSESEAPNVFEGQPLPENQYIPKDQVFKSGPKQHRKNVSEDAEKIRGRNEKPKKIKEGKGSLTEKQILAFEEAESGFSSSPILREFDADDEFLDAVQSKTGSRAIGADRKQQVDEKFALETPEGRENQLDLFGEETSRQADEIRNVIEAKITSGELDPSDAKTYARQLAGETLSAASLSKRIDEVAKEIEELIGALGGGPIKSGKVYIKSQISAPIKRIAEEQGLKAAMKRLIRIRAEFSKGAEKARETGNTDTIVSAMQKLDSGQQAAKQTGPNDVVFPKGHEQAGETIKTRQTADTLLDGLMKAYYGSADDFIPTAGGPGQGLETAISDTSTRFKLPQGKTIEQTRNTPLQQQLIDMLKGIDQTEFNPKNLGQTTISPEEVLRRQKLGQ